MSGWVRKKGQITYLTMPNSIFFMKCAEKSVPGLADVGVPHGDGDGSLFSVFIAFDFKGHEKMPTVANKVHADKI